MNSQNKQFYEFGSFRLDPEEHILLYEEKIIPLTPKAFDTLLILIENNGHVVDKNELLEQVWSDAVVEEANVAKYISQLRKILSEDGLENPFIETIPKRGYRFVAPVTEVEDETSEETEKPSESSFLKSSKTTIGIIAPIFLVAGLAIGVWYLWTYLMGGNTPALQSYQFSLLTENGVSRNPVISPDGKIVAFVVVKDTKRRVFIRRIAAGTTIEIVPETEWRLVFHPTFSRDGEFIYYILREKNIRTLYRVPVLGGSSQKLIKRINSRPAVSPDGNQLAFYGVDPTDQTPYIVITDKEAKNLNPIIKKEDAGYDEFKHVSWSNDGRRLLVTGFKNAEDSSKEFSAIWVNKDDKTITEAKELEPLLGKKWFLIQDLKLLKDGSGIMFTGQKKVNDRYQIYHLSMLDGTITPVSSDTSDYYSVSISDNGETLVADKVENTGDLISYDLETQQIKQIIDKNKVYTLEAGFSQTPDGRILVTKTFGEGVEIFRMDENGSNEIQLTSNGQINSYPIATADGKYIVFVSKKQGDGIVWFGELWRMNPDGSNPIQLTNNPKAQVNEFGITKDGQTIFFDQQSPDLPLSRIMKVSIDGGEVAPAIPGSSTSDIKVRVSPDGRSLAFKAGEHDKKSSKWFIRIHSLNGGEVSQLKNKFEAPGGWYDWMPDGKTLSFLSKRSGSTNVWNIDVRDGKGTALLSSSKSESAGLMPFAPLTWSHDGKKVFIVRRFSSRNVVLIKRTGTLTD